MSVSGSLPYGQPSGFPFGLAQHAVHPAFGKLQNNKVLVVLTWAVTQLPLLIRSQGLNKNNFIARCGDSNLEAEARRIATSSKST